jgi:hypothetical protein
MVRTLMLVIPPLLLLSTAAALGASQCGQASVVSSHLRLARSSQNSVGRPATDESCRLDFKQFIEAVTARQAAAGCPNDAERQRALEALDAEIQIFNDRIADRCGQ